MRDNWMGDIKKERKDAGRQHERMMGNRVEE